jgi:hypothetical protein
VSDNATPELLRCDETHSYLIRTQKPLQVKDNATPELVRYDEAHTRGHITKVDLTVSVRGVPVSADPDAGGAALAPGQVGLWCSVRC